MTASPRMRGTLESRGRRLEAETPRETTRLNVIIFESFIAERIGSPVRAPHGRVSFLGGHGSPGLPIERSQKTRSLPCFKLTARHVGSTLDASHPRKIKFAVGNPPFHGSGTPINLGANVRDDRDQNIARLEVERDGPNGPDGCLTVE
jgi:hypothetical protein